jgi:flavin-dependent dehydrogenase
VHFGIQASEKQHVLLLGDAAGCIAPITGNGMSNALRSAWFVNRLIFQFFEGKISRNELEKEYARFWTGQFSTRIKLSRSLQRLAEKPLLSGATIHLFNLVPGLGRAVVKLTHGQPF